MPNKRDGENAGASAQLRGTVRRLVPHIKTEWAEIFVEDTDQFWNTIRVRNPLQSQDGSETLFKTGDRIIITVARAHI